MKSEPTLNIPVSLLEDQEFIKWLTSAEGRLWLFLSTQIVRKPFKKPNQVPEFVYNNFYVNGKLATSWGLAPLAKLLGYGENGKSNVCRIVKRLEKKRFLKKHMVKVKGIDYSVFELGYKNSKQPIEIPYVYEHFTEQIAKKKIKQICSGDN